MSRIALVLGIALGCCLAFADDGFVGDWEIKQEFRGQERVSTLSITEADGGLKGSWETQRGTNELSNMKVDDGTLSFSRTFEGRGQEITIDYEVSVVDGKLAGKMITPRGEREFAGMRKNAEPSFVGAWDILIEIQGREMAAKLDVTEKEGKVAGHWSSQLGESDLEDIAIADGELTFSRTVSAQGQELDLDYAANLVDGKLAGTIGSEMGDIPFTGTRVEQEDKPADDSEAGRAKAMLQQIDGNGDDKITEDEAPEQMKQYFSMIDQNGDGHIDATEMIMVIQFMDQQN